MPQMDGFALHDKIKAMGILLPVIMMTAKGDVKTAVRAIKGGATDFIEKPFDDDSLVTAIKLALVQSQPRIKSLEVEDAAERIATLTPRERAVLYALVAGHPNKVIAFDFGLSVRTVEAHRARMMDRLGVTQISAAVRLAVLADLRRKREDTDNLDLPAQ
jgi:two-component system response regulator FixJ